MCFTTSETLIHDIEAIPYRIVNEDTENYREGVYRIRSMVSERVRLAMGMSLHHMDNVLYIFRI